MALSDRIPREQGPRQKEASALAWAARPDSARPRPPRYADVTGGIGASGFDLRGEINKLRSRPWSAGGPRSGVPTHSDPWEVHMRRVEHLLDKLPREIGTVSSPRQDAIVNSSNQQKSNFTSGTEREPEVKPEPQLGDPVIHALKSKAILFSGVPRKTYPRTKQWWGTSNVLDVHWKPKSHYESPVPPDSTSGFDFDAARARAMHHRPAVPESLVKLRQRPVSAAYNKNRMFTPQQPKAVTSVYHKTHFGGSGVVRSMIMEDMCRVDSHKFVSPMRSQKAIITRPYSAQNPSGASRNSRQERATTIPAPHRRPSSARPLFTRPSSAKYIADAFKKTGDPYSPQSPSNHERYQPTSNPKSRPKSARHALSSQIFNGGGAFLDVVRLEGMAHSHNPR